MTGNETEDGKKDDGCDLKYNEWTGGNEVGNVGNQANTGNKFSKVSSVCLLILGVTILVLLGVGVAMIVKTKSNASDEDNVQGAVGGEANPEQTPPIESTEEPKGAEGSIIV